MALVTEDLEGRPIDEGAPALHVDAENTFRGRIKQSLKGLLPPTHLAFRRDLDARAAANETEPGQGEHRGDDNVYRDQQPLRLTGRLAELGREGTLQLRQSAVQKGRLLTQLAKLVNSCVWRDPADAGPFHQRLHLLDHQIALAPDADRLGHERHAMEPPEEPNQAIYVIRMVASTQKPSAGHSQVGACLLELFARLPVA